MNDNSKTQIDGDKPETETKEVAAGEGLLEGMFQEGKYDEIIALAKKDFKERVDIIASNNSGYKRMVETVFTTVSGNPKIIFDKSNNFSKSLKACWSILHLNINGFAGATTVHAITIGKIFAIIQDACKDNKKSFKKLIEGLGYKMRTVQRYIRLAKSPGIENYAYMGSDRLDFLLSSMDRSGYEGTVGDFLDNNGIDIDPVQDRKQSFDDFKIEVASGIMKKFNDADGWGVSESVLEDFAEAKKGSVNYSEVMKEVATVKETGGTPEKYFSLMAKGGPEATQFKLILQKIKAGIDELKKDLGEALNKESSRKIVVKTIDAFIDELTKLKTKAQASKKAA